MTGDKNIVSTKKSTTTELITEPQDIKCLQMLEKINKGDYTLLPSFAQELVAFLYEGTSETQDVQEAVNNIAQRGLIVLQHAHKMETEQSENEKTEIRIDYLNTSHAIVFGYLLGIGNYMMAVLILYCLKRNTIDHFIPIRFADSFMAVLLLSWLSQTS
jgi:hypothetical protein